MLGLYLYLGAGVLLAAAMTVYAYWRNRRVSQRFYYTLTWGDVAITWLLCPVFWPVILVLIVFQWEGWTRPF